MVTEKHDVRSEYKLCAGMKTRNSIVVLLTWIVIHVYRIIIETRIKILRVLSPIYPSLTYENKLQCQRNYEFEEHYGLKQRGVTILF